MVTEILLTVVLGLFLFFYAFQYGNRGRKLNLIPGPPITPLVGNVFIIIVSPRELWKLMRRYAAEYYPIYRLWTFTMPYVNIFHPNDMETILGNSKSIQKSIVYNLMTSWFGTGLLTSSGRKWHMRRKILTNAFHFNVLQQFADVFIEESERLTKSLKDEGGPVVKDLTLFYSEHTLNVICETAMGTSLEDKGPFQLEYRKAVYDMGKVITYRLVRPWLLLNFVFNLVPRGWEQTRLLKILHGFTEKIIEERKDYHNKTNGRYLVGFTEDRRTAENVDDDGIRKRRLAMLDLLIAAHRNNEIDNEGIREEVDTFMFRGHDTTAVCLCYTTMLLAEHKEIQDRARTEVNAAIEESDGKVTISTLQNVPYLERCIKESLRLYPSVPFISRKPEMDMILSNYDVPADTVVHMHILDTHRDPRFWPNPDVFDPDRFLPENVKGRHPYSYIPFSAGPRNCIGQRFAMLELKATLLYLLRDFYFEPVDLLKDTRIATDLVLRAMHPLRTRFVPIETTTTFAKMLTGILLLIVSVLLLQYFVIYNSKFARIINEIPGPRIMPIFGNLLKYSVSPAELWNLMRRLGNEYYPIYRIWTITAPMVYIRHPDDMEVILGNPKSNQKSDVYDLLLPWFNTGLLTSSGPKWQARRKILTPAFHFTVLQQFSEVFMEETERLISSLKAEGGPVVKDLMHFYSERTLNMICETAMGVSLKDKGKFQYKYRKAISDFGDITVYRFVRPWLYSEFLMKVLPLGWRLAKVLKIMHNFTNDIIAERKDYHNKTNGRYLTGFDDNSSKTGTGNDDGIRKRRLAMLDLLIAAHRDNQIDDAGIREEVDTFMFRGHDTTAVCLCFTTMLLAQHKEIQDRAREEADAVMAACDGKVTMSTLQDLPYLERCIKESLRLYPSVPFISRRPEMDMKLGNHFVPANTVVNLLITDTHRDPRYWPNPDTFNPDRFLPENSKGRHPYSYLPFSAGPRNCIGQRFAMMEVKTTLLYMLHNFYFEPVDPTENISMNVDVVLRPTNPIRTKFIPIEH
ncbi:uncharacterized protein LOC128878567 [Hylaeus volcanicus]|nr:uncharacterized protein LOC128878567 [Hylaeus volcanicus]